MRNGTKARKCVSAYQRRKRSSLSVRRRLRLGKAKDLAKSYCCEWQGLFVFFYVQEIVSEALFVMTDTYFDAVGLQLLVHRRDVSLSVVIRE